MKAFILSFAFFLVANYAQATIRRCNNNVGVAGTYLTIQDAHDAASPGDTIHLEPSAVGSYGVLYASKKVTIISTGYFLNQNTGKQATVSAGYCDAIHFYAGSEYSTVCGVNIPSWVEIDANNISLISCDCVSLYLLGNSSNTLITKSYVGTINYYGSNQNTIITNNFIHGIYTTLSSTTVFNYNTVFSNGNPIAFYNTGMSYNIFEESSYPVTLYTGNSVTNNIETGNNLPTTGSNVSNVNFANVFASWATGFALGDDYQLKATYSNQNLGMYAGSNPYRVAGIAPVPSIYLLTVPAANVGNTLNFTVSTRSNN